MEAEGKKGNNTLKTEARENRTGEMDGWREKTVRKRWRERER